MPKKIKIGLKTYHFCNTCRVYEDEYERDLVIKYNMLNDEVEIIEEVKGIEKLGTYYITETTKTQDFAKIILSLGTKINEIIDKVNKLNKEV